MFGPAIQRLITDLQVVRNVLTINEYIRDDFYLAASKGEDNWSAVRRYDPSKTEWQVFDHCAVFTRLYAIFEQFVEEIALEYILVLPHLYDSYRDLPEPVITQHRLGFGQIMMKLGKEGPYRDVEEEVIVRQISSGIRGETPYVIASEAFFVDRQNYRLDRLAALYRSLGFLNLKGRIEGDARVRSFLSNIGATSIESELKEFVERRNEAAHSEVSNIVGAEAAIRVADLVSILCHVLADAVKEQIWQRSAEIGWYEPVAAVKELHYGGRVVVVDLEQKTVEQGEEFAILRNGKIVPVVIQSIQISGQPVNRVKAKQLIEVGLTLNAKAALGCLLVKMKNALDRRVVETATAPETSLQQPSTEVEMQAADSEGIDAIEEQPLDLEE